MIPEQVDNQRINRAIDFLEASNADEINLSEVADIACLSKYHFVRVFRDFIGETPISFLQRIRLERSARQLVFVRSTSIGDVAYNCGFSSAQSFSTVFHRRFGTAPREYRSVNVFRFDEYWSDRDLTGRSELDIELGNDGPIVVPKFTIENRTSHKVAYIRFVGPYGEIGRVSTKFERLRRWARQQSLLTNKSQIISISWDNPNVTPPDRCRLDVCLPITDDIPLDPRIGVQTIPGGTYAVMHVTGENMDIRHGWEYFLMHWLPAARYVPTLEAGYEIYSPSIDGREHFCRELCLPVRRV